MTLIVVVFPRIESAHRYNIIIEAIDILTSKFSLFHLVGGWRGGVVGHNIDITLIGALEANRTS